MKPASFSIGFVLGIDIQLEFYEYIYQINCVSNLSIPVITLRRCDDYDKTFSQKKKSSSAIYIRGFTSWNQFHFLISQGYENELCHWGVIKRNTTF